LLLGRLPIQDSEYSGTMIEKGFRSQSADEPNYKSFRDIVTLRGKEWEGQIIPNLEMKRPQDYKDFHEMIYVYDIGGKRGKETDRGEAIYPNAYSKFFAGAMTWGEWEQAYNEFMDSTDDGLIYIPRKCCPVSKITGPDEVESGGTAKFSYKGLKGCEYSWDAAKGRCVEGDYTAPTVSKEEEDIIIVHPFLADDRESTCSAKKIKITH
jgi:hypothetical protein